MPLVPGFLLRGALVRTALIGGQVCLRERFQIGAQRFSGDQGFLPHFPGFDPASGDFLIEGRHTAAQQRERFFWGIGERFGTKERGWVHVRGFHVKGNGRTYSAGNFDNRLGEFQFLFGSGKAAPEPRQKDELSGLTFILNPDFPIGDFHDWSLTLAATQLFE